MDASVRALREALEQRGARTFLRLEDRTVSGGDFLAGVQAACEEARKLPVELAPGSVVAMRGLTGAAQVAAQMAAWALGCSTYLLSAREPEARLKALVAEAGCTLYLGWSPPGAFTWTPVPGGRSLPGPVSTLMRTSGSSGAPKVAVHALAQHVASARGAADWFRLSRDDRWLLTLPTWHVGGLGIVLRTIVSGAALCIPSEGTGLAEALRQFEPTHVSLVSTQLQRLLQDEGGRRRLAACAGVLVGGGPIPPALRHQALEAGIHLVVSYGSTETSALVAASADAGIVSQPESAGRALPGRTIAVDASGHILVGGPTLFRGYLEDGAIVDPRADSELFTTGDLGHLDDGVLFVAGRADRMFISGGENVQPEEIEAALLAFDGVHTAAVVAVPSEEFGARPVAFVACDADITGRVLDESLRTGLPGYKVPDAFYAWPQEETGRMKPSLGRLSRLAREPSALKVL